MGTLKLLLENFQSISSGELEFETGLNFIIGQSNSGKSATFRALKACLSNPSGSQRFIKYGANQSTVTVEYNGNSITWKRTPKESSYIINGETYVKTGSSNAFKIIDNAGFSRDTNDTIMNIEEELQLPFPFGMSKSDLFKLYEDVFCISDSAIILKSAKDHEEGVKDEIKSLEAEYSKGERKLEEIKKFKEDVDINKLESFKSTLMSKQSRLNDLKDGLDLINKAVEASEIKVDTESVSFEDKISSYMNAKQLLNTVERVKKVHALLSSLKKDSIEIIDKIGAYKELIDLKDTMAMVKRLSTVEVPSIEVTNRVEHYAELVTLKKAANMIHQLRNFEIPSIDIENKLNLLNSLKEYKNELVNISTKIKKTTSLLKQQEETVKDLESKLKQFDVCPLCHRPLHEDVECS